MEYLKEKWEDPKTRNIIIAIPAVLIIYFVMGFMSDKSKEGLAEVNARHQVPQEEIQVFSTQGMDELSKQEVIQMKQEMAQDAAIQNRDFEITRKANDKKSAELAKQVLRSQQEITNLKKMMYTFVNNAKRADPQNAGGNTNNQNQRQSTGVNSQQNSTTPRGQGNLVNQNQTTILTRTPTPIEGDAIRTITQRQIRSVKSTGDIDIEERKNSKLSQIKERRVSSGRKKEQETLLAKDFFLPMGSIMSGTLLNGVDAPTASGSLDSPMPILLRIKKEAILPNHFTMDVRECHMLASAVGELSSERVQMRAEAISCVLNDGRAIEKNITAYAVSSFDGKVGIRGRLVSRNGQAIARAMMAGFVSGMSDASSPQKILSVDQAPGNSSLFQKANPTDILGAGAFKGASSAMDRLANYYTEMAENMHPIIEISAGTQVDFIVQKGMSFKLEG